MLHNWPLYNINKRRSCMFKPVKMLLWQRHWWQQTSVARLWTPTATINFTAERGGFMGKELWETLGGCRYARQIWGDRRTDRQTDGHHRWTSQVDHCGGDLTSKFTTAQQTWRLRRSYSPTAGCCHLAAWSHSFWTSFDFSLKVSLRQLYPVSP